MKQTVNGLELIHSNTSQAPKIPQADMTHHISYLKARMGLREEELNQSLFPVISKIESLENDKDRKSVV